MDILSDKVVITRKRHRCSACGRSFDKGTKMRSQVNVDGGEIGVWRECSTCQELLSGHLSYFENDCDNVCYEGCVIEILDEGETPKHLLKRLNTNGGEL